MRKEISFATLTGFIALQIAFGLFLFGVSEAAEYLLGGVFLPGNQPLTAVTILAIAASGAAVFGTLSLHISVIRKESTRGQDALRILVFLLVTCACIAVVAWVSIQHSSWISQAILSVVGIYFLPLAWRDLK